MVTKCFSKHVYMVYWDSEENAINWYYQEKDKSLNLKFVDLFKNRKPLFGTDYSKHKVRMYNIF